MNNNRMHCESKTIEEILLQEKEYIFLNTNF